MKRWLALSLGLLVAGAAGFALLSRIPHAEAPAAAVQPAPRGAPLLGGEIGEQSRRQLEAILAAEESASAR